MECRKLDITVVSAKNLPDVSNNGRMKVYGELSINGNPKTVKRTTVDKQNQCNPIWNSTITYTIAEKSVRSVVGVDIVIKLFCEKTFRNHYIGEVRLPVKSLLGKEPSSENIDYPVGGTANGILSISYKVGGTSLPKPPSGSGTNTTINMLADVGLKILITSTLILITGGLHHGFDFHSTDHSDMLDSVHGGGSHHAGSGSDLDFTDHSHVMLDDSVDDDGGANDGIDFGSVDPSDAMVDPVDDVWIDDPILVDGAWIDDHCKIDY